VSQQHTPIIEFDNFNFQYHAQSKPSLRDINLKIYPGEKVLIAGPSGSGKSTLANCINGLIPFNYKGTMTGTCRVAGRDTKKLSVFELSRIVGTVLQDTDGQFVGLTAAEDIAFSLENNSVSQAEMRIRVKDAAKLVDLPDELLNASPYDLSGGQKQRVSVAGILVDDVEVLLFDEPLASLDPATGKYAIDLIDRIHQETATAVVIIEHRIEDVLYRPVDRIVLMDEGRIVADGKPDELLAAGLLPAHGLREPLYVTALRYAGVPITPEMHPASLDDLVLTEAEIAAVREWFHAVVPAQPPVAARVLLAVDHVEYAYDDARGKVIDDIAFNIAPGEIAAIVGTNGAGKSTMAKLICGFEKPDSGRVIVGGVDVTNQTIYQRAQHVGYVMQNPNQMICTPIVYDEVAMGLVNAGLPQAEIKRRVEQTLRACGLYGHRNWPISALSYGQKKRVTIASVLVMQPDILILDEPTAGQDYAHYTEFMEFLTELQGALNMTILLITHDMHLMLEYAPRSLVFSSGKLIADLPSSEVLSDPAITAAANLKETSLYYLAMRCGVDPAEFTGAFVQHESQLRMAG